STSVGAGAHYPRAPAPTDDSAERVRDDLLGLLLHLREVLGGDERLGVDLVDVLRARRARGEPRVLRRHLEAADRRAVAGRRRELRRDLLAREVRRADLGGVERGERRLLLEGRG